MASLCLVNITRTFGLKIMNKYFGFGLNALLAFICYFTISTVIPNLFDFFSVYILFSIANRAVDRSFEFLYKD